MLRRRNLEHPINIEWCPRNGNYNLFKSVKIVHSYVSSKEYLMPLASLFSLKDKGSDYLRLNNSSNFQENRLLSSEIMLAERSAGLEQEQSFS